MKKLKFTLIVLLSLFSCYEYSSYAMNASRRVSSVSRKSSVSNYISQAEKLIEKGEYTAAKAKLEAALKSDSKNEKAKSLLSLCNSEIEDQQAMEGIEYKRVCESGNLSDYKDFIAKHPNSKYTLDAKKRVADFDLWKTAKQKNTEEAYKQYLSKSSVKLFADEANEAIKSYESEKAWLNVRNSEDIAVLNDFINKYPNSKNINSAQRRLAELKGVQCYKDGALIDAYYELGKAGGREMLSGADSKKIYDECEEYYIFKQLNDQSSENDLFGFLAKYPDSKYKNEVSNAIAKTKAQKFDMYLTDVDYQTVMGYATDIETKRFVSDRRDQCKKEYEDYLIETARLEKEAKALKRKKDGGWVQFGIEPGFDYCTTDFDYDIHKFNFYFGLNFKIGNNLDRFQFEISVKPGVTYAKYGYYDEGYYDSDEDSDVKFILPISGRLKINLFNLGQYSRFYISGLGGYNAVRFEELEGKAFWGAGFGFASRSLDWHIYMKKSFETDDFKEKDYSIGTSLGIYF